MNTSQKKYLAILIIFIVCLICSFILAVIPTEKLCSPNSGCSKVQTSSYSEFLTIKISIYGVAIFTILIILTISFLKKPSENKKSLLHSAIIIGSLFSIYFLFIQHFILQEYCKYCLIIDFSLLITLFLIIQWKRIFKK